MSLFIHVGQCGNQVGGEFWDFLRKERKKQNLNSLFHRNGDARCILVDTEPKVLQNLTKKKHGKIFMRNVHYEQFGRGNNWAMGYYGPISRNKDERSRRAIVEDVMESLRKEIESMDVYHSTFLTHSLGGGTGAGLGSILIETHRDYYPKPYIISTIVGPAACGDTPLQNYNSVLTLSALQEYADCVVYKENDELLRTMRYWKSIAKAKEIAGKTSISDINKLVALDLIGLVLPTTTANAVTKPYDPSMFINHVCPLSTAKFVDVRTAYSTNMKSTLSFPSIPITSERNLTLLSNSLKKSLPRPVIFEASAASISSLAIVRGVGRASIDEVTKDVTQGLKKACNLVEWNSDSWSVVRCPTSPLEAFGGMQSVTLCSNRNSIVTCVERVLSRAKCQFEANAYLHWYEKFGCTKEHFYGAFEQCEQIVDEYRHYST